MTALPLSGASGPEPSGQSEDRLREAAQDILDIVDDEQIEIGSLVWDRAVDELRSALGALDDQGPWEDEDPRHYAHRMGDEDV